jgi:hypothetical protein
MVEVEQISLLIRMEFSSFEGYWPPFTTGEGYIAGFSEAHRARLTRNVRRADLADRPRSFVTVTRAGRGQCPRIECSLVRSPEQG